MSPSYDKDLVGIHSEIEQIENWLQKGDVHSVGIWGIGGIGKTTLAQAVSRKISCQFDRYCFTGSIRSEKSRDWGLSSLRKSLLSTLLDDERAHMGTFTENRLRLMKVLIIFDDVTEFDQINSLIGDLDCLAPGSRIIVTSRDKQVL
ncbi:hypothetical protein Dsin_032946 [Dipteronia sinensis]|uniref:NB-ARC domain-containing protein n=1 Tax=Dipteronia sinensis TaxID=43782 RepID=A0AAD9Z793_9ROSI|nr:hypothetical protein Dsin_032946 [Dipteronia sinensis]